MIHNVTAYQVNVVLGQQRVDAWVNLMGEQNTQIGRFELHDMELFPYFSWAIEMLARAEMASWDDQHDSLGIGTVPVGGD